MPREMTRKRGLPSSSSGAQGSAGPSSSFKRGRRPPAPPAPPPIPNANSLQGRNSNSLHGRRVRVKAGRQFRYGTVDGLRGAYFHVTWDDGGGEDLKEEELIPLLWSARDDDGAEPQQISTPPPNKANSTNANNNNDILALPHECLEAILAQLDHDTLFKCSEVCTSWRDLILRPGGGERSNEFGLTVWRAALERMVGLYKLNAVDP
jgi:hypothetical protein